MPFSIFVYTEKFSAPDLMLVGLFTGESSSDAEYELYVADLERLAATPANGRTALVVTEITADHAPIPAAWRKRIAAVRAPGPSVVAIVTSSSVHRGVATAIQWMRPGRALERTVTYATPVEAFGKLEAEVNRPVDRARDLHARTCEAAYGRHGRLSTRTPRARTSSQIRIRPVSPLGLESSLRKIG